MFNSLQKSFAKASTQEATNDDASGSDGSEHEEETLQGFSRSQLLQRIQDLTERNERFERRFRDVVGAYKNILTEKAALEDTVSALASGNGPTNTDANDADDTDDTNTDHTDTNPQLDSDTPTNGSTPAVSPPSSGKNEQALQRKITALAKVVSTLTEEKTTIQTRFQDDKKIVAETHRAEIEQVVESNDKICTELKQTIGTLEKENVALKANVAQVSQQLKSGHEAEKKREAEWQRVRVRHQQELEDLRKTTDDENTSTKVFDLKEQLQKARDAELDALTQLSSASSELKDKITSLEEELSATKDELMNAHTDSADGDELLQLKQEVSSLQRKCGDWQKRAMGAEQDLNEAAKAAQESMKQSENKLAQYRSTSEETLRDELQKRIQQENRFSELSAMVGQYESARVSDSEIIANLREENTELAFAAKGLRSAEDNDDNDGGGDDNDNNNKNTVMSDGRTEALEAQVLKLKSMLAMANRQLSESFIKHDGLNAKVEIPLPSWETNANSLSQESDSLTMQKIQMEAAMYYRKAQSLSSDLIKAKDALEQKTQIEKDLRVKFLRVLRTKDEKADEESVDEWKAECLDLRNKLTVQESEIRGQHEAAVDDLRTKIARMRDRALALVRDRDTEIARLRHTLKLETKASPSKMTSADDLNDAAEGSVLQITADRNNHETTLHDEMQKRSLQSGAATARQQMREMQLAMTSGLEREQLLDEQVRELKEEIRRLERNAKREGANLEYLKNVVVRYMSYQVGRDQTLVAIATILQFSPNELEAIHTSQPRSWWPGSPR
eukprot:m.67378 g.67378  ORF g.67378 m.67378 type:complete len:790 (+) comp23803_c0_seq1:288-2657(+)